MGTTEADVTRRFDYAIFEGDEFVTNALLTVTEVQAMERDGYRCLRVRDTLGETLPAFRSRRSVARPTRNSGRWDR